MTWNIEQFPLTIQTSSAVADIIGDVGPDLLGVQEIADSDAFDALVDGLPEYEGFDAWDSGFIRVGLMYRSDRIQLDEIETIYRDDTYAFPRAALTAKVTATSGDGASMFDFYFIVLHLKAKGDSDSRARRRRACEQIDRWIERKATETGEQDFVVVGDLNDRVTDDAEFNVFGAFLDKPDRYLFLTTDIEVAGGYSYIPFNNMIDHVLITTDAKYEYGSGQTMILELDETIPDYLRFVSDHRPVLSRFIIR